MPTRNRSFHKTAQPLLNRLNAGKVSRSDVAREMGVSAAVVSNWLTRGVPAPRMPELALLLGITFDQYRAECGFAVQPVGKQTELTDDERDLIQIFRKIDANGKAYLLRAAHGELNSIAAEAFSKMQKV